MASSGYRGVDGDNKEDRGSMKWPLEYSNDTKELTCGWCGQALTAIPPHHDIEAHFQICEKPTETAPLMDFKCLLKVNQKMEGLYAVIETRMDKMKAELMEKIKTELDNIKIDVGTESNFKMTQLDKMFLDLKSNIKQDLETEIDVLKRNGEKSDAALSTLLNKVHTLEEKIYREMGVDPAMKTAQVTISTADNSILLKAKTKEVTSAVAETVLLNELDPSKNKKKKTKKIKKRLEEDERPKSETANQSATKKNNFDQEQLTIPMNCFNLVTGLFQPSFRWTIDDIAAKLSQKVLELSSEMFQWNGYPVEARAKIQVKEDGYVYVSLCLEKDAALKDGRKSKDFAPIPRVYYLLKDLDAAGNPRHKCLNMYYLVGSKFEYSLGFEACLGGKSCFNGPPYNVNDRIEIEIYVEPPMMMMPRQGHSRDGTLEWAIDNYARRVQLEEDGLVPHHESPYFYTGPRRCRVRVEMSLRRDGGRGASARVVFVSGDFDAKLPKSFLHKITVTLINRKNPERSSGFTIDQNIGNKFGFAVELCKIKELENLIENDTLFCKVVIKAQ